MGIEERLTDIGDRLAEQGAVLKLVREEQQTQTEQIMAIRTDGIGMCREHGRRITALEDRPAKALATISTVSGILGGVAGWLAGLFGSGK